jgi:hypothetical protein
MTFAELQTKASEIGINGEITTDNNGQIVIYTGLVELEDGELGEFDADADYDTEVIIEDDNGVKWIWDKYDERVYIPGDAELSEGNGYLAHSEKMARQVLFDGGYISEIQQ